MSEFSFENENQPIFSSVSSCFRPNISSIWMSSLSSLINAIFIIVSHGFRLLHQEFSVMIENRNKNISKLHLWVHLSHLPNSVVSALVRESVGVIVKGPK